MKLFNFKMVSRRSKIILYVSIIRPTLTYGCEAWTTTTIMERRLRTFKNKVWEKNVRLCVWHEYGKLTKKIQYGTARNAMDLAPVTNFIKCQRTQWLDNILRREDNDPLRGVAFKWKPQEKRPLGRPRKRWMVGMRKL